MNCVKYLREFSKKFETALTVYSEAWGKLIYEKNMKSKIFWHCPFKIQGLKTCLGEKKFKAYRRRLRGKKGN
jgi:hypothetical protein